MTPNFRTSYCSSNFLSHAFPGGRPRWSSRHFGTALDRLHTALLCSPAWLARGAQPRRLRQNPHKSTSWWIRQGAVKSRQIGCPFDRVTGRSLSLKPLDDSSDRQEKKSDSATEGISSGLAMLFSSSVWRFLTGPDGWLLCWMMGAELADDYCRACCKACAEGTSTT